MLQDALAARLEMQRPQTLWRGSLVVLASLIALIGVVWIEVRAGRSLLERIQALVNRQASTHRNLGVDWSDYAFSVIGRALQLAMLVVAAGLVYLWLGLAFEQFPATAPIALGMGHTLRSTLEDVTAQFFKVLPDIGMIALVLIAGAGRRGWWPAFSMVPLPEVPDSGTACRHGPGDPAHRDGAGLGPRTGGVVSVPGARSMRCSNERPCKRMG